MLYTLGQAKRILEAEGHAHGTELRRKINTALQALAGMNGWECLRKLVRLRSAGPVFSLPQGTAGLVRACINGKPAMLHGQDFQFLSSGPGDLAHVPAGFLPLQESDIADLGEEPVWLQPEVPVYLAASVSTTADSGDANAAQPKLHVVGLGANGERISADLDVQTGISYPDGVPTFSNLVKFTLVERVVLDDSTDSYVTLAMRDASDDTATPVVIGHYHPEVKVPMFRRYQVAIAPHPPVFGVYPVAAGANPVPLPPQGGPYDILAEVRVDPLPLVDDSDVVPLPSLEPVKCMLLYQWNMETNETQAAQAYQQAAAAWLTALQNTRNVAQTPVVVNSIYGGSSGEMSNDLFNI